MGTCPFTKTWWFLEAHDGSWLANIEHELFTRDPNEALKWPNETRAREALRGLHHDLWFRLKMEPTEHAWVAPEARATVQRSPDGEGAHEGCEATEKPTEPLPTPPAHSAEGGAE